MFNVTADMIPSLFTLCEKYISENLAEETVLDLFRIADLVDAFQLKRACLFFTKVKFGSQSFQSIPGSSSLPPHLLDQLIQTLNS